MAFYDFIKIANNNCKSLNVYTLVSNDMIII